MIKIYMIKIYMIKIYMILTAPRAELKPRFLLMMALCAIINKNL
jgi:hypothetical protein